MTWIKVKNQLPPKQKLLLFINGKKEITLGSCFDYEDERRVWIMDELRVTNEIATHWMPLPELPNDMD